MGHAPPKSSRSHRPPDRESYHIGIARSRYLRGKIDVEEFESDIWYVLQGGHLTMDGYRAGFLSEEPIFPLPEIDRVMS